LLRGTDREAWEEWGKEMGAGNLFGALGLLSLGLAHGFAAMDAWPSTGSGALMPLALTSLCVMCVLAFSDGRPRKALAWCGLFLLVEAFALTALADCALNRPMRMVDTCYLNRLPGEEAWSWSMANYAAVFLVFGLCLKPAARKRRMV
jgi:hypothetical protein